MGEGEAVFLSGGGAFGVVDRGLYNFCSRRSFSAEDTGLPDGVFTGGKLNAFDGGFTLTLGAAGA